MNEAGRIRDGLRTLARLAEDVAERHAGTLEGVASRALATLTAGGKLLFCGNGGSAADAQHLAAEYVVRFGHERRALAAVALTTDTSVLTAAANDHGFETVFARQVEALAAPGDLLFLHSTSGRSPNLVLAAEVARAVGVHTVAFLAGSGGPLKDVVDEAVIVPTDVTARAQELHLAMGHLVCDLVERGWVESVAGRR